MPEQFRHLVLVRVLVETSARQAEVASGADDFLADGQPLATHHAEARGYEIEEAMPETNLLQP